MKKKWLLYFALPIALGILLPACGDDKDDPVPDAPNWTDAAGDYSSTSTTNVLDLPGLPTTIVDLTANKSVKLAVNGDAAKLTLTNFFPEQESVEFDNVAMTPSGSDYSFEGTTTAEGTTLTVKGTLSGVESGAKKLTIQTSRAINNDLSSTWKEIVGTWKLTYADGAPMANVYVSASLGDSIDNATMAGLGPMFGMLLAQKVSEVNIYLTNDGLFDFKWKVQGETELTGMPENVKAMGVTIPYYFKAPETLGGGMTGELYISLDKQLLPILGQLISSLQDSTATPIDINAMIPQLVRAGVIVDNGGFIAIPISVLLVPDSGASFYIGKEMLTPLAAMLLTDEFVTGLMATLPEEAKGMEPLIRSLPTTIASAESFTVGMVFSK